MSLKRRTSTGQVEMSTHLISPSPSWGECLPEVLHNGGDLMDADAKASGDERPLVYSGTSSARVSQGSEPYLK